MQVLRGDAASGEQREDCGDDGRPAVEVLVPRRLPVELNEVGGDGAGLGLCMR